MVNNSIRCPACLNEYGSESRLWSTGRDSIGVDCTTCGKFEVAGSAHGLIDAETSQLTTLQRAALSHRLRTAVIASAASPMITTTWLEQFLRRPSLPTPAVQAANVIRFIGQTILTTGSKVSHLQPHLYAVIGAPSPAFAGDLLFELKCRGLVDGIERTTISEAPDLLDAYLTLGGWERFQAEQSGTSSATFGFLAMKFGDARLEDFVTNVLKPCVRNGIGYELLDMRDVARAGIIDNIMRAQIRDASFVIVDLTHDNSGAYWEAGYAEGLGKPVIYICESEKFAEAQTHFDTNHSTTVVWAEESAELFRNELIATLRRSLNLFAKS